MFDISSPDMIYFQQSREYFKEVLSNYANGNYRSAVVMLYSVVICDLLYKLQELNDIYDDSIAKSILKQIDNDRTQNSKKPSSQWEKDLIKSVYERTEILDDKAYTELVHLQDYRNYSAHPAMNEQYELIAPSRETTIALMKNAVDNILSKPPYFAKKIVEMLSEDLAEKKEFFIGKDDELFRYLERRYYSHMSQSMKKNTFKALWKFCFALDDEECKTNRVVNRKALEYLYKKIDNVRMLIKTDPLFKRLSNEDDCMLHLAIFLSKNEEVYGFLEEDLRLQIKKAIASDKTIEIIAWFASTNKKKHLEKLCSSVLNESYGRDVLKYVKMTYENEGLSETYYDFCIKYYGDSSSFDIANARFDDVIKDILPYLKRSQFIHLIKVTNDNYQLHGRRSSKTVNNEIVGYAVAMLGDDFDYSLYPNFEFDEDKTEVDKEDEDRKLI